MLYSQLATMIALINAENQSPMTVQLQLLFANIEEPVNGLDYPLNSIHIVELAYIMISTYPEDGFSNRSPLRDLFNQVCDLLDEHYKTPFIIQTLIDVQPYLADTFSKDKFILAMNYENPVLAARVINLLSVNNIDGQMVLDVLAKASNCIWLCSIMYTFHGAGALNRINMGHLLTCKEHHLPQYEHLITELIKAKVTLSPNIVQCLIADDCLNLGQNPARFRSFIESITILQREHLLTTERVEWLLTSQVLDVADAFKNLKTYRMLTEDNADCVRFVCLHPAPEALLAIFSYLHNYQLHSLANFKAVYDATTMLKYMWIEVFLVLLPAELANQNNFDNLIEFIPYLGAASTELLSQLPPQHVQHQPGLDALIALMREHAQERHVRAQWQAEHPDRPWSQFDETAQVKQTKKSIKRALHHYVQRLMVVENPTPELVPLNAAQNTHTASIHKSAAESALALAQLYQVHISDKALEAQAIADLHTWGKTLNLSVLVNRAAFNGLARLLAEQLSYVEPRSQISLRQLLLLVWYAIEDNSNRMGSLADAQKVLIDALYEIQRGYNLNDLGVDNADPEDLSICAPGTFNKLMEKMVGVSPVVRLKFITLETASLKLPRLIKEQALSYLEANQTIDLINELIKTQSIAVLEDKLLAKVTQLMYAEFHCLFHGFDDAKFIAFIEIGFADFDVLAVLGTELKRLKGEIEAATSAIELAEPSSSAPASNASLSFFAPPYVADETADHSKQAKP